MSFASSAFSAAPEPRPPQPTMPTRIASFEIGPPLDPSSAGAAASGFVEAGVAPGIDWQPMTNGAAAAVDARRKLRRSMPPRLFDPRLVMGFSFSD